MQRIPTSFALSLWLGFHVVTGLSELANAAGITAILGHPIDAPVANGVGRFFVAALTLGTSVLLAASLVFVHSPDIDRLRRGELLGFAGIGISSAMVLGAFLFGAPFAAVFDRIDLALWSVALSLLALAFDNCVFAPDDEDDEIAFRRSVELIQASIPRDVGRLDREHSAQRRDV